MAVNEQYYTILTSYGKQALANAQASGTAVNITEFAVGDGNGSYYSPNETQTALKNEVYRAQINRITTDPDNPNWIIVEGIIPADQGGFTIREIGIFDDQNNLVAIGNYPETYKPVLSQGSGNDMYIRFIMEVENVDSVQLKIDPAIVLASRKYVDDEITAHDTSSTAHADIRTEIDNIKNGNTTVGNADKLNGLSSVNFIKALFHAGAVANTDLNSLIEAQTVYCDTTNTNLPSSYAGYLLVFGNGANRIGQLFLSQDGNLYFRKSDDGTNWNPWGKVWFNGNDGIGSGLDADLIRGLPADFTSNFSSSGYQKLPSGLIIQWGNIPRGSNDSTISVVFPIAFPNAILGVGISMNSVGLSDARISRAYNVSLTGFDSVVDYFGTARDSGYSEFWIAIGH